MTTEQQPSDAELISAVRGGDTTAYGELFSRHVEAARRLARQLSSATDVEDLVSEAFAKVLTIVQRGGGPDLAFRAYLLTAVRSLHVDSIRGSARLQPVDDFTPFDDGVPFRDTAVEGFESQAAARAFATLPERWQLVLWHTEVEGQKPADVAMLLGMSANSVSALAYRAREGLRQAFLNMHAQDTEDDACAWTQDNLGAYIRNAASKRDSAKVRAHVDECRRCMGIYLELSEVNTNLSGILGPLVLGSAAAGYIASAVGGAAHSGVLGFIGRAGEFVGNHTSSVALAGVAATIVLITGLVIGLRGGPQDEARPVADAPVIAQVPQTFGADAPTLSPADQKSAPSTRPPRSAAPDDPGTALVSMPGTLAPSATPGNTGTPDEQHAPDAPQQEPDGSISVPPSSSPPTTPPPNDVRVRATSKELDREVWNVNVQVQGLEDGGGTVTVNPSNNSSKLAVTADPMCQEIGGGDFECTLGPDAPSSFNLHVIVEQGAPSTQFAVIVKPAPGVEDAVPGNNTDATIVHPQSVA